VESRSRNILRYKSIWEFTQEKSHTSVLIRVATKPSHKFPTLRDTLRSTLVKSHSNAQNVQRDSAPYTTSISMCRFIRTERAEKNIIASILTAINFIITGKVWKDISIQWMTTKFFTQRQWSYRRNKRIWLLNSQKPQFKSQ